MNINIENNLLKLKRIENSVMNWFMYNRFFIGMPLIIRIILIIISYNVMVGVIIFLMKFFPGHYFISHFCPLTLFSLFLMYLIIAMFMPLPPPLNAKENKEENNEKNKTDTGEWIH